MHRYTYDRPYNDTTLSIRELHKAIKHRCCAYVDGVNDWAGETLAAEHVGDGLYRIWTPDMMLGFVRANPKRKNAYEYYDWKDQRHTTASMVDAMSNCTTYMHI